MMRASMLRPLLLATAVLVAAAPREARAWPVDVYVEVAAGAETFTRFEGVDWVEVEDTKIASAEPFPSGEVLVNGLAPGRTLLLVYGQGRFSVWRVTVSAAGRRAAAPATAALGDLEKACPRASLEGKVLRVAVPDDRCRRALRAHLEKDGHRGEDLDLTFELAALQAQLADLGQGLAALGVGDRVSVRYLGAGLVLRGKVTAAEHRQVLWEIFRRSAGRAPLDDQLVVQAEPAADAGTR